MSRINTKFHWITTGALFVVYFLYFFVLNPYHLIYLEQIQLFRFNGNYFADFLSRPGGLSEFTGAFLTQFFIFPVAGASIVTLAGIAVYAITVYIFHKHHVNGVLLGFVPVLLLAALHSYHLYTLAYTIGLIFSLGYFAVYISIKNNKLRYFVVLTGWPLLYFIAGGYALLTILLCFIHELFFNRNRSRFIIASLFPIIALLVPYLASHFIFYIRKEMASTFFLPFFIGVPFKYILILLLVYYPLILIVTKGWLIYSKGEILSPGWNWKTIMTGTLVIVCLSGGIIKYVYDRKTEVLLGIDHCIQQSDWEGALKHSSSSPFTNRMLMHFTNLALYKTGHMGDQLFNYPQAGSGGLWLDWGQDWVTAFFGGEIYYQLAYNSEAYRWAFEAMVAKGPNPRSLKRLVLTSLVDDNIALAEKYLKVLEQTLFYREWAHHYLSFVNHPELIKGDKEISEKRHFEIYSDFISSDNFGVRLPQLLADHSDNRMVFEYYMASLLLDKNLDGFASNIYRLKELGYKSIPVQYEEALLAYMSYSKKNIVPEGYNISMATRDRLSDYAGAIYSFGDNTDKAASAMNSRFGKTYWYYLKFINSQPR
jgi:hypothetical protein